MRNVGEILNCENGAAGGRCDREMNVIRPPRGRKNMRWMAGPPGCGWGGALCGGGADMRIEMFSGEYNRLHYNELSAGLGAEEGGVASAAERD